MVFDEMGMLGKGIAVLAIVLVVGFLIMTQVKSQIGTIESITVTNATQCAASTSCTAVGTLQTALATVPGWVPIIVIVAIGGLILRLTKVI